MKQMNKEKLEMRRKQFEIPNGILALREQRNSRKVSSIEGVSFPIVENVQFLEGYETTVKEIKEKMEKQPCKKTSTCANNIHNVLKQIWKKPANKERLEKMGFTYSKYVPIPTEIFDSMGRYININEKEAELQTPKFILDLKVKDLSREENIRYILEMLRMPQFNGCENLVQAIAIQCEKITPLKKVYEEISQIGEWRRIEHSIKSVIKKAWQDETNEATLKEMKLNFNATPTNKQFIFTIVEYIKMIESEMSEKEMKVRNLLQWLEVPKAKVGYEEIVKKLIALKV